MNHWPNFVEFVKKELATGGPDPQIPLIGKLCEGYDVREKVWLAGCYGAHHCVPSAYIIWKRFRPKTLATEVGRETLFEFLLDNWEYLPVRPEMRSHRMPEKRLQCLLDFAWYSRSGYFKADHYDEVWKSSQESVKYFGRYMALKYLEFLRRFVNPKLILPDLRSRGAWSPRRTLAMLYPGNEVLADKHDKSREAMAVVDFYADTTKETLRIVHGIDINFFQLQVMLCEYRESLVGGYYFGASHDEELDYMNTAKKAFPEDIPPILEARRAIFPIEYLGEVDNRWDGVRHDKVAEAKRKAKLAESAT